MFFNRASRENSGAPLTPELVDYIQNVATPPPPPAPVPARNVGYYGNAGFASVAEVKGQNLLKRHNGGNGIYLGSCLDPYAVPVAPDAHGMRPKWHGSPLSGDGTLEYVGQNNLITFAPSGSGKGTAAIIPTLLTCDDSAFVLDVKGENYFVTLPARHLMGHDVVPLNPFNAWADELGFDGFMTRRNNPLHDLHPDKPDFVSQIHSITAALIVNEGKDPHWQNRSRNMIAALIAYVCSDKEERTAGHNTLPYVYDILGFDDAKFAAYLAVASKTSKIPLVRNAASFVTTHTDKDGTTTYSIGREVASIRSTALGQLNFLDHDGIRHFLSGHDFSFADLRKKPMTIFCIMPPDELDTYYRFARIMVQTCFKTLSKTPRPKERRVLVLLDEQAKLRHMEIIETSVALLRGYRVRVWSIFQDCNQLKSIYGDAWETFISNSGVIHAMTTNDQETAKYFSERVGNETITETKTTVSRPNVPMYHPNPASGFSTSEQSYGVPFLSPQDLHSMPEDKAMLISKGMAYPILAAREHYHEQDPKNLTFNGMPYAPHPVHNEDAFDWMKRYLSER